MPKVSFCELWELGIEKDGIGKLGAGMIGV
jgi:hypothetical protein